MRRILTTLALALALFGAVTLGQNFETLVGGGGRLVLVAGGARVWEVNSTGAFIPLISTATFDLPESSVVSADITDLTIATGDLAAGAVTSDKLAETTVQYAEVSYTSAQVKAMRATPLTLIASPGAGKVLEFVSAVGFLDYGSNVFTESDDNLAFYYAGETIGISEVLETTGFIDQNADTMIEVRPTASAAKAKAGVEDKAITIKNPGDGEIAGNAANDSVLRFKVVYRVHTTGW